MFGESVRAHRRRLGLTQEELASETGISVRTVGKIEAGRITTPRPATVRLIADAFGLHGADRDRFRQAAAGLVTTGPTSMVPAQLPPDVWAFTGRTKQIERLDALLSADATAVVITAVSGTAGVGKTALAVHWSHRVRDRFPDGQLYVNLRGHAHGPPVRPLDALAGLLTALGVPANRVPADLDQATALYRSFLADRRVLILLDNASVPEQVRPLLPGAFGCVVLVTSRDRLGGLVARDGARPMTLDVLTAEEAHLLLTGLVGADRVASEPDSTAELARVCACLPLALRIAAANLAEYPDRSIASYVADLRTGDRLSALAVTGDEDTAVRATFDLSYAALPAPARQVFRRVGLVPGPYVTAAAAAALTGIPAADAADVLNQLAGAHLLTETAPGQYSCHDLLRRYAADRTATEDSGTDRAEAVHGLYRHYLGGVRAAMDLLRPDTLRVPREPGDTDPIQPVFSDHGAASAWLDAERPNLVAAVVAATATDQPRSAWQLADALRGYFWMRTFAVDWVTVAQAGNSAARSDGDTRAEAAAALNMADALHATGRYDEAVRHHRQALALAERAGWLPGQAAVLNNLGAVHQRTGQLAAAVHHYRRALALRKQLDDLPGQAGPLLNLGSVTNEMGQFGASLNYEAEASVIFETIGSRQGLALALGNRGQTCHRVGRLAEAREQLDRALAIIHDVGHRGLEAYVLCQRAEVDLDVGRHQQALNQVRAALAITRDLTDRRYEPGVLNSAGEIYRRLGRAAEAVTHHERALSLARETEARQPQVQALIGLTQAHIDVEDAEMAGQFARKALTAAREAGYRYHEAQALAALAAVELATGRTDSAVEHASQALDIHHHAGHRLDEAHTHAFLSRALRRTAAGREHEQRARALYAEMAIPTPDSLDP